MNPPFPDRSLPRGEGNPVNRLRIAVVFSWIVLSCASAPATTVSDIRHSPDPVPAYEKIEITFTLSRSYSNPYDPDEVDVRVEFEDPAGERITMPAFWFVGYDRVASGGGGEDYVPTGVQTWMARVVGRRAGVHRYRILVTDLRGEGTSQWRTVTCTAPARPGFVRVDARNPRYLVFDDGTPYRPVGCNLCWAW